MEREPPVGDEFFGGPPCHNLRAHRAGAGPGEAPGLLPTPARRTIGAVAAPRLDQLHGRASRLT
jgi:hypothetical protein